MALHPIRKAKEAWRMRRVARQARRIAGKQGMGLATLETSFYEGKARKLAGKKPLDFSPGRRKFLKAAAWVGGGAVAAAGAGVLGRKIIRNAAERKARVRAIEEGLKKAGLNPRAAETAEEFGLGNMEARTLQEIASGAFGRKPGSLTAEEFGRVVSALNISSNGNPSREEFRRITENRMRANSMSLDAADKVERERLERVIRAQELLRKHPKGLELARKIWGHSYSLF